MLVVGAIKWLSKMSKSSEEAKGFALAVVDLDPWNKMVFYDYFENIVVISEYEVVCILLGMPSYELE